MRFFKDGLFDPNQHKIFWKSEAAWSTSEFASMHICYPRSEMGGYSCFKAFWHSFWLWLYFRILGDLPWAAVYTEIFQVTTLTVSLVIVYILFFHVENRCWCCRVCFMLSTINKMWPHAAFVYQSEAVSDTLHCVWQLWSQPFVQYNNLILTVKKTLIVNVLHCCHVVLTKDLTPAVFQKLFSLDFLVV